MAFSAQKLGSEELRQRINELLGLEPFDIYGLSEIIGPGVSVECPQHNGLHIFEDHFIPEIVNPSTGEPVKEGEVGELVLTTITREATPQLRFRTGDLTKLTTEEYELIIDRPRELDVMTLRVEPKKELFEKVGGDLSKLKQLRKEISDSVKSITSVKAQIELVPYGSLQRFMGKAKRVRDLRKKKS